MLIRIEDAHFAYTGGVTALCGVTLSIEPSEQVALLGENGSGKTTLARHLNGLLHPQHGSVRIGDWLTSDHSPAQMARRVAYVFQNPDEQLFSQQVWDEVAFGPRNLGYASDLVQTLVENALNQLGLSEYAQLNPRDLGYSGRKRVALASALAMDTPVLVFDEPTAGLDASERDKFALVLGQLRSKGKTVLVISHDIDFVVENLDRLVLLHQGQIAIDALAEQFFTQVERFTAAGVDMPQITRLSQRLGHARLSFSVEQFLNDRS